MDTPTLLALATACRSLRAVALPLLQTQKRVRDIATKQRGSYLTMSVIMKLHIWGICWSILNIMNDMAVRREFGMCQSYWFQNWREVTSDLIKWIPDEIRHLPKEMCNLVTKKFSCKVLNRIRLRDFLRLRQALLTRELTAFDGTVAGPVCHALGVMLMNETAGLRTRARARTKAVKLRGFKRRRNARVVARRCEQFNDYALGEILRPVVPITPPSEEARWWWNDTRGLIGVLTDTEERAEILFRALRPSQEGCLRALRGLSRPNVLVPAPPAAMAVE